SVVGAWVTPCPKRRGNRAKSRREIAATSVAMLRSGAGDSKGWCRHVPRAELSEACPRSSANLERSSRKKWRAPPPADHGCAALRGRGAVVVGARARRRERPGANGGSRTVGFRVTSEVGG